MATRDELLRLLASAFEDEDYEVPVLIADLERLRLGDLPDAVEIVPCSAIDGHAFTQVCEGVLVAEADGVALALRYHWPAKFWGSPLGLNEYHSLVAQSARARERSRGDVVLEDAAMDYDYATAAITIHTGEERLDRALRKGRAIESELLEAAESVAASIDGAVLAASKRLEGWGEESLDHLVDEMRVGTAYEKGLRLEELTSRLFQQVPGFRANGRVRTQTEEIDIRVSNDSDDPLWRRESALLLVECKNWSSVCGREQFSVFKDKLRGRVGRVSCGFLVSWNGFAGTIEKQMLRGSEGDLLVVPITGADLRGAVRDGDFPARLRQLHEDAVLL